MAVNLLDTLSSSMGSDVLAAASKYLGESETSTKSAMSSLLPALLTGMSNKAATPAGAADLYRLVTGPNVDTGLVGNLASFLGGGEKTNSLLSLGGSLASSLLGSGPVGGLASSLASLAGIRPSGATSLIAMAVPFLFSFLKKYLLDNKTDANGLASLLGAQKQYIDRAGVDSGLLRALGLGAPAAAAAPRAAVPPPITREPERKAGWAKWLPWLIGAIAALLLWNFLSKPTPAPTPPVAKAPAPATPAPAPAPAVTAALPVSVYFETAKYDISSEAKAKINAVAEAIKKDNRKVEVTGYTDKRGDLAMNEKLAKDRATAVKDALVAAGIPEGNISSAKPVFVEIGAPGADADARRVEIRPGS
jgi:outer membrane protein OmpA-like peptidoglycan-associated protein